MQFGQPRYAEQNELLNRKLTENRHLIAVHRGSWAGNVIQSTVPAYKCAFRMGADMVEGDVNRTTDGQLFIFHDGYEKEIFHTEKSIKQMTAAEVESFHPWNTASLQNKDPINRLSDVLDWLPEDKMINLDRAWDIFPDLLEELDRHPNAVKQVLLKSNVRGDFHGVPVQEALNALSRHPVKYMYMPICYTMEDVEIALSLQDVNVVGCELIAHHETDELYQDWVIASLHDRGLFAWANAIQLGNYGRDPLFGPLDDDISVIQDPGSGWGAMFRKGIDIIQTDWPAILYAYRQEAQGAR